MKILITTGIYPPSIGGPATYSKLMFDELPKRGIETDVISFDGVRHLPKGVRHFVFFVRVLRASRGKDVIYAQDTVSVGLPSLVASVIARKKFAVRIAGDYVWEQSVQRFGVKEGIDEFQSRKYGLLVESLRRVQNFVARRADGIITPSHYFRDLVSGWVKGRVHVAAVYNGINLNASREHIELKETDRRKIISAGRMVSWKGFDCLIGLLVAMPDYELHIAGDGPEMANLKEIAREKEVEDRVKFHGAMPAVCLRGLMDAGDVFVLNTSFESFSFVTVEAMNAGIPVVATDIGNLSEIIRDGEDGILVKPNDATALRLAIKRYEDDEFRNRIINKAKARSENFSIEKTLDSTTRELKLL